MPKFLLAVFSILISLPVQAAEKLGMSKPWQMGFQEPASPVMERLVNMHNGLLWMAYGITAFVTILLIYVAFRFNKKSNPVPSKTTHNALIEVIWTVVPVLILVAIIIPSWRLINYMDKAENAEITIKAIGYQWYWGYEYVDGPGKGIAFEAYMKTKDAADESLRLQADEPRLLATDNKIVLPVDTEIRILTTAADVIHGFAVPAFGIKMDAVPGRTNETWVKINKIGIFYGQCSELCGSKHAFMPIEVHAVSMEDYLAWVSEKGGEIPVIEATEQVVSIDDAKETEKVEKIKVN
jgi:cytochrome c oxidase subunit 2